MKTAVRILKITLVALVLLTTAGVTAQSYSVLHPEQTYLYEGSEGYIYGMRVDSVSQQGEDVTYHLLRNLQPVDYFCFIPEGPSWMGNKIRIRTNGESVFYNHNNEPVTFKTQANLNEAWICYTTAALSFRATVSSIEMGEILGLPDTLKTISFQALDADGQNIAHQVNELQVVLSKNYGMQKTLNFYSFPQFEAGFFLRQLQQMTLAGFDQPEAGIHNLSWIEVHDYGISDILHVEEIVHSLNYSSNKQTLRKVLGKQILGDTIVYQIEEKIKYSLSSYGTHTFTATIDTIDFYVGSNPDFDVLPGIAYAVNSVQDGFDINHLRQGPHHINKLMGSGYCVVPYSDTCYDYIIVDGCIYNHEYIKGLGGPYYHCTYLPWDEQERKLVYYKKGYTEWGTPLEFNVGVNGRGYAEHEISIYPNPTTGMTYFSISGVSSALEISIYSITGKEVLHKTIVNQRLNLGFLPKGIYLVKISGDEFVGVKKLEIR